MERKWISVSIIYFLFISYPQELCAGFGRLYSTTDFMLFDSADLVYFEVLKPQEINYVYKARPAKDFGTQFNFFRNKVNLVVAEPAEACQPLTNGLILQGAVVLVERGGCSFVSKAKNVEHHGGIAVLIADNKPENAANLVDMVKDETGRDIHIPAGFLLGSDGYHIRRGIEESGMLGAEISIPVNVTTTPHLYTRQPPWSYW